MIKVETFLGCAKLETGGRIIGWISLIGDIFAFLFSLIAFVILCVYGCNDMEKFLRERSYEIGSDFQEVCGMGRGIAIGVLVFTTLIGAAFVYMSWLCIKGCRTRKHGQIKPLMIVMAILTILSFLNILSFKAEGIVSGIVYGVVYGYAFVVLYSLFAMFREESERGFNPSYHVAPGAKV